MKLKTKRKSDKIRKQQKGKILCNVIILLTCFYGPNYFCFRHVLDGNIFS